MLESISCNTEITGNFIYAVVLDDLQVYFVRPVEQESKRTCWIIL